MLDWIEVWAIWRQVLKRMPFVDNSLLCIPPFVECGVIHHDDRCGWQFGQQVLPCPAGKDIGIHVGIEHPDRQQVLPDQRADHVGTPVCVPVVHAVTPLPCMRIAVPPRHVVREAALVNVHNRPVLGPIRRNFILEDAPFVFVRLGVPKRFL